MKKRKRGVLLASIYAAAAIAVLGGCVYVSHNSLSGYRLAAKYSSGRAFEETVHAVDGLSQALEKSVYATDGSMCAKICGEAYANAQAAEAALSTLPFATQELEKVSGFLNVAGDYAYTLCSQAAEQGFTREQVETLSRMAGTAAEMAQSLQELRGGLNDGSVMMDSRELRLINVGEENTEKLSDRLLAYEESFQPQERPEYDGMYGIRKKSVQGRLSEEEMRTLAAEYAGVEPEELESAYEYRGEEGRRCFTAGETTVNVSSAGVESLSQSRLVGESRVEPEKAERIAADYLKARGYRSMELKESAVSGALCMMKFAKVEDGAVCLDNTVSVSVALDDGSIYSFDAAEYSADPAKAVWNTDRETAQEKLPEGLKAEACRKVILRSAGDRDQACYEFRCDDGGREVRVYVDAATGEQCRIELGERPKEPENEAEASQPA